MFKCSCSFIPVYCFYEKNGTERKDPLLILNEKTKLLEIITLNTNEDIFTNEELTYMFISEYKKRTNDYDRNSFDSYDVELFKVGSLIEDDIETTIYTCELFSNCKKHFEKVNARKKIKDKKIYYSESLEKLLELGIVDKSSEKILKYLGEEHVVDYKIQNESVTLF